MKVFAHPLVRCKKIALWNPRSKRKRGSGADFATALGCAECGRQTRTIEVPIMVAKKDSKPAGNATAPRQSRARELTAKRSLAAKKGWETRRAKKK